MILVSYIWAHEVKLGIYAEKRVASMFISTALTLKSVEPESIASRNRASASPGTHLSTCLNKNEEHLVQLVAACPGRLRTWAWGLVANCTKDYTTEATALVGQI